MRGGTTRCLASVAIAGLTLMLLAPASLAHTAAEPLDIEIHTLQDEGEDAFYWYDGYDLYELFVREAHWGPEGQDGLMFRFTLYGGFTPQPAAEALHIDIGLTTPAGEQVLRMTTTDDEVWTGDLQIAALNVTEDSPPFTGVTSKIQAFVPYEALNVTPGQTVSEVWMASYADEDLRDISPGPFFLPGSQGQAGVPAGESQRLVDDLQLAGPVGYFDWNTSLAGGQLTVSFENTLNNTGQHVGIEPVPTEGWQVHADGPTALSLDPGDSGDITFNVSATANATTPLALNLESDLGGFETLYLGVNGSSLETGLEAASVDVAPDQPANESPGAGTVGLLAALGAALAIVRRRR